ncbi:hypothetical protein HG536_0G03030 [Torulaspora globosa]|uniref:Protein RCR2 n=1 Tax=Torulaspora globosa TaxID=48254 RepID=A0A7G3ZLQ5_9SACH|nr:uncharacterized protein HG536_0G03030 [Torulaspora globosa]QLL34441.1 hypothetical protein HG536_0G03030 [Torulaspora globosa]
MSPIIRTNRYRQLYERTVVVTDNFDSSSGWIWGRWILFVIFVICIIAVGLGTARINRRRRTMGQAPILGTAWMTPPSYRQSQRHYNGPVEGSEDYVPQYTATANDQDLGYYDEHGEFHLNSKAEAQAPPAMTGETVSDSSESLERPRAAVTRDSYSSDLDQDFRRYVPPPPSDPPMAQPNMPGGFEDNAADTERSGIQVGNSDSVALQEISPPEKVKSSRGL